MVGSAGPRGENSGHTGEWVLFSLLIFTEIIALVLFYLIVVLFVVSVISPAIWGAVTSL